MTPAGRLLTAALLLGACGGGAGREPVRPPPPTEHAAPPATEAPGAAPAEAAIEPGAAAASEAPPTGGGAESADGTVAAPAAAAAPDRPLEVRVTGDDYHWILRYPGADGLLDTADDRFSQRNVHLPAHSQTYLDLASADYAYTFYVPDLDIKEVAVPDVPFEIDLETGSAATHRLLGSQMCGYTHPLLLGDVVIEEPDAFAAWLATLEREPPR